MIYRDRRTPPELLRRAGPTQPSKLGDHGQLGKEYGCPDGFPGDGATGEMKDRPSPAQYCFATANARQANDSARVMHQLLIVQKIKNGFANAIPRNLLFLAENVVDDTTQREFDFIVCANFCHNGSAQHLIKRFVGHISTLRIFLILSSQT